MSRNEAWGTCLRRTFLHFLIKEEVQGYWQCVEKPQILSAVSARPETGSASTPSLAPGHTGFPFPSRPFRDPIYTFGVLSVVSPELWPLGSPQPQADMGLFCGIPQSAVTSSGVPLAHSKSYLLIPASGLVPGMQVTSSNCAG